MNKIVLAVFFAVLISINLLPTAFAVTHTEVSADVAKQMIDSNPSLVILDVRNQSEYDTEHIRNARLIPLYELPTRLIELDKNDTILVYCKGGFRSHDASLLLDSNDFLHVYDMEGGINAWKLFGYPVYVKYSSIQQAINNASPGDTLLVSSGIYYEHVAVNKSVSLVGENKNTTIVDGSTNGTVFYVMASDISISDFTIRQSGCGCYGYCGIRVTSSCQNVTIRDNNVVINGFGIMVNSTREIVVTHNNISGNAYPGVSILNSSNISVLKNVVKGNFASGINLTDSNNNAISGNTVSDNIYGLYFSKSGNNSVFDNTFASNDIYGAYLMQSNETLFFHNNFVQNARHIRSLISINDWDNGIEGNYWSNYTGVDSNQNGIGEMPHIIDLNNQDNHPLVGMHYMFATSLGYDVEVVSNSTVTDFEYFQSNNTIRMHVVNGTSDQAFGFIRICIPHALLSPPYTVLIDGNQPLSSNVLSSTLENTTLYITYIHSEHDIIVIPEFHSMFILSLFMILVLVGAALPIKKKSARTAN